MARFGFGSLRPVNQPVEAGPMVDASPQLRDIPQSANFLAGMGQSQGGQEAWKPGIGEILDRVLGLGITDAIDDSRARHDAAPLKAQAAALRQQVLQDPRELLAYLANPGKWGESVSGNYAPANINGGDTRMMPGYGSVTAPKYEMSGDSGVQLGPAGLKILGQRPQSQTEEENSAFKQSQLLLQQFLAKSMVGHRDNQDAVARGRLAKVGASSGGGGSSGLPPGYRPR